MSLLMARFERVRTEHNQSAYRVHCCTCAHYTDIVRPGAVDLPPDMIAKKARQRGWDVDKKGRAWCPECQNEQEKPTKEVSLKPEPTRKAIQIMKDIADEIKESVVPLPPRTPTPTDLRRIMREIDDNWDEAKGIYSGSTSDQSIADKLNVPRAWVADERKRAFGESQRNEAMDNMVKEAKALERECRAAMQAALDHAALLETQLAKLVGVIKKLEKLP
jgi:hypothetical protein